MKRLFHSSISESAKMVGRIFTSQKLMLGGNSEISYVGGKAEYHKLNDAFKEIKQVGVLGWGPQAKAQAQNLRDTFQKTGIDIPIKIGLRDKSKSEKEATSLGFEVSSITDIASKSDLVLLLLSDSAQTRLYSDIFNSMKDGSTLGLSHGFLLGYLDSNNEKIPAFLVGT